MNVRYAHVQDYFNALHQTNHVWQEYSGDFFPYNDDSVSYWTVRILFIYLILYYLNIVLSNDKRDISHQETHLKLHREQQMEY